MSGSHACNVGSDSAKLAWDTSCLVALLSSEHRHHQPTLQEFERHEATQFVISAHSLLECFSVMTRLPPPFRLPAHTVEELLRKNLQGVFEIVDVTSADAWTALEEVRRRGMAGGGVYDAAIAQSVVRAGAKALFTWNLRDFLRVAPPQLEIRVPLSGAPKG